MAASDRLDATFAALADPTRRAILTRLSLGEASVSELAEPFKMSQPAISKHLKVLENAGLIVGRKRGQFIHYSLVEENLVNTLNGFVQEVCPVSRPLKRESRAKAHAKGRAAAKA